MVGLITAQGARLGDVDTYQRPGMHQVDHICGRTSETFAQAYYYAIDHAPGSGVAMGTDLNGPVLQPGPRFGPLSCPGGQDFSRAKWEGRLNYPFLARGSGQLLDAMSSGMRVFDFNEQGMATIGQLPDLIGDLEVLGIPPADLEPLFHSAEAYIRTWERAVSSARNMIRPMRIGVTPAIVSTDAPATFTVTASDPFLEDSPLLGDVFIDNRLVGSVGQVVTHTFASVLVPQRCTWVTDPPDVDGRITKPHRVCEPAYREVAQVTVEVRAPGFQTTRVPLSVTLP